jgi:hypothetical protein
MKKNKVAVAALAAALSLGTISVASADTTTTPAPSVGAHGPVAQLTTVLATLVAKGTITQAQSDAIVAAVKAAAPTPPTGAPSIGGMGKGEGKGPGMGMGKGPMGGFGMNTAAREAIITSTLGITAADLKTAREAGKSLASLAGTKTAALITALVNYDSTQIDAAVAAKTLTADQATTLKAGLTTRVTNEVNKTAPAMGRGGHDGPGMGQAPKIPGSGTATPGATGTSLKKAASKKSTTKTSA